MVILFSWRWPCPRAHVQDAVGVMSNVTSICAGRAPAGSLEVELAEQLVVRWPYLPLAW